ncbi:hypothetical protein [Actinomyces glycerinitolerans]|uniref:Uncharacterized protein n=1 Tax=Actinomyces glycerinitolerans TaxID=1892869 RepID=A0A1M4RWN9_9ACTO|nr:hypothetical protein [Actinomyces glycerinitolerans]SHE24359.1 Hypothetical protein ACGLYG10_0560 [Actinomyces glycerinitolerans]
MNDLERRIRNSRPRGPGRNSSLSRRAQADFTDITGHVYDPQHGRPAQQSSPLERATRSPRFLIPVAAAAAVVLAVGSFAVTRLDRPSNPDAEAESITDGSYQPTLPQSYEDVQALAEASDLVIIGSVDGVPIDPDGTAVVDASEVLAPTGLDVASVRIRQEPVDSDGQAPLAGIGGDKAVLFLTASDEPGLYTLTHPTQGILEVDEDAVYPLLADIDMKGAETVSQLRNLLQGQ